MKNNVLVYIGDGRKNPWNTNRNDFINGRSDTRSEKQKFNDEINRTNTSSHRFVVEGQKARS